MSKRCFDLKYNSGIWSFLNGNSNSLKRFLQHKNKFNKDIKLSLRIIVTKHLKSLKMIWFWWYMVSSMKIWNKVLERTD